MSRTHQKFTFLVLAALLLNACQPIVTAGDLPNVLPARQPVIALQPSFLFNIRIDLESPRDIGSVPELGVRHLYYFEGGEFVGPEIAGEVLAGGENWFLIRNNCVCDLFIQGQLRTDDGALINFAGHAYSRTTPDVRQSILDGAPISTEDYSFRGIPFFETDAPQYEWLNHAVTVATYRFEPEQVIFSVYAIR